MITIYPKSNDDATHIGHYYGSDRRIEESTGYAHNSKTFDPIETIVSKVLEAGFSIMILNKPPNKIVYISKDRFVQK